MITVGFIKRKTQLLICGNSFYPVMLFRFDCAVRQAPEDLVSDMRLQPFICGKHMLLVKQDRNLQPASKTTITLSNARKTQLERFYLIIILSIYKFKMKCWWYIAS